MNGGNPWCKLRSDDYERHMGHGSVGQLQVLSRIAEDQLELVRDISGPTVAILGITCGNGLEHIEKARFKSVIGIDISEEFLNICRERYSSLTPVLQLHQVDLICQKRQAVEVIRDADLVTANLLVEHIHLDNFIDIVRELEKPILSVAIQVNPDGGVVSHSGFESAFDEIVEQIRECGEGDITGEMAGAGYALFGRAEYALPNGKAFVRLDFRHKER